MRRKNTKAQRNIRMCFVGGNVFKDNGGYTETCILRTIRCLKHRRI